MLTMACGELDYQQGPNELLYATKDVKFLSNLKTNMFNFFLFYIIISIKPVQENRIYWKNSYQLKWNDFQGKPDTSSKFAAITKATVKYSIEYTDTSYSYVVGCFFNKELSWVIDTTNLHVLEHENGHFDIAEIFTRKLRKGFKEYKFNSATIRSDFKKIYNDLKKEDRVLDSLYDKETDFHRNYKNQKKWNTIIANELKKLQPYSTDNKISSK